MPNNAWNLFDLHLVIYHWHSFHSIKYPFTKTNTYTWVHLFSCPQEVNTILWKMKTKLLDFPFLLAHGLSLFLYFSVFPSDCTTWSNFFLLVMQVHIAFTLGLRKRPLKQSRSCSWSVWLPYGKRWSYSHYLNTNKCVGNRNLTAKKKCVT